MSVQRAAKRRGSQFEVDFVNWLRESGWPDAERRHTEGKNDRGDIAGVRGWTLELKATKQADMGSALAEAKKESDTAGTTRFALVKKWRNHSIAEAMVILPAWLWNELIQPCRKCGELP